MFERQYADKEIKKARAAALKGIQGGGSEVPQAVKALDAEIKQHIAGDPIACAAVAMNFDTAVIFASGGDEELAKAIIDTFKARIIRKCRDTKSRPEMKAANDG